MNALNLPLNKRAQEILKQMNAPATAGMPATSLLIRALETPGMLQDKIRGSKAMMRDHLDLIQGMPEKNQAEYLFGEEGDLDPGADEADVLEALLEMLHLRMTENVEGYPPSRTP
jgi:hypothetical protein